MICILAVRLELFPCDPKLDWEVSCRCTLSGTLA